MPRHLHIDPRQTAKQLAKYKRQKCISLMEKLLRNLFRMFRDESIDILTIQKRFDTIYEKITELGDVPLHSEYNRAMRQYIDSLLTSLPTITTLDTTTRQHHLTQLNRIQKIKNATSYKKTKYQKDEI